MPHPLRSVICARYKAYDGEIMYLMLKSSEEQRHQASKLSSQRHNFAGLDIYGECPDSRLPKAVFYGKLSEGKRKQGGQMLQFKDVLKRHMKNANVKSETWEQDALDRRFWRATLKQSVESIEEKLQLEYQHAHKRRHSTATLGNTCSRCNRICHSRASLAAHQRFCLT